VSVRPGTGNGEGLIRGCEGRAAPNHRIDAVDHRYRKVGEIGNGLLADGPAFPPVMAQQDGIASAPIPDGFDVVTHGSPPALGTFMEDDDGLSSRKCLL